MTIKILVDMNLSPDRVPALVRAGWEAVHWSAVGDPGAPDDELMTWAAAHGHIVFTHDLDFGAMLALAQATGPSVLQLRSQKALPEDMAPLVAAALR